MCIYLKFMIFIKIIRGFLSAGRKGLLSAVIFSARTERLFNHISSSNVEIYLSGILIGAELSAISTDDLVLRDPLIISPKHNHV
ncbi:2-dehydro-3-deoxygalactonokinase [Vibrio scophthalmi]|uniref:2-dehydro-3-deoxygalactonokinase n=1 Tax=Vibrio scophthalmi TaxID=45658 RepID=UPI003AAC9BD5